MKSFKMRQIAAGFVFSFTAIASIAPAAAQNRLSNGERFTPAVLRADFTAMYESLQSAAFDLYAFTKKPELDRAFGKILASLTKPMSFLEAQIRFQEFVALIHVGHARVDSPAGAWRQYLENGGRAFPLALRIVNGRTFIAQNRSGVESIARGDEIVKLNGRSMPEWLQRTERHVSAETPYMAHSLMEFDFPMYLWVEAGTAANLDLVVRKGNVKTQSLTLPARTQAEMKEYAATQPPSLNLEDPLRDAKILPDNIAYLRPGPFYNAEAKTGAEAWDVSGFQKFIDHAFARFVAAEAQRLIIDLRGNPGGDNLFSDIMVAWFADKPFRFFSQFKVRVSPESIKANADRIAHDAAAAGSVSRQYAEMYAKAKPGDIVDFEMPLVPPREGDRYRGQVFLLIDRQSYSNAVAVAALVQDYKFGLILGEETSDRATTYGAMEKFKLPETGLTIGYPKAKIVRPNGDLRSRGVIPDIAISIPTVESPVDEVLQRAIAIARERSK